MKILLPVVCLLVIGAHSLFFTSHVYSQDFDYELTGVIYDQLTYRDIDDDNLLNPHNDILDFSDWTNRLYGRITFNLHYKNVKFISQTRPTMFHEEGDAFCSPMKPVQEFF